MLMEKQVNCNFNQQELNTVCESSENSENSDSFFKFRPKSNDLSEKQANTQVTQKKEFQQKYQNQHEIKIQILQPILQQNKNNKSLNQSKVSNIKNIKESLQQSYKILQSRQIKDNFPKKLMTNFGHHAKTQEQEQKVQINKEQILQNLKLLETTEPIVKHHRKSHRFQQIEKQIYVLSEKQWKKDLVVIDNGKLMINGQKINFGTIFKLKIFKPQPIIQMNQLKISLTDQQDRNHIYFVNVKSNQSIKKATYHYLAYIQLVIRRLKAKGQYLETIWEKKTHKNEQKVFGSYIFGQLYKKSQNLGKWEKRYIIINSEGIFSYKSFQRKEHSFFIQRDSISYIWTRFQFLSGYLIVKLKHSLKQTEFAIPVVNFSYPHHKNWLYYFYKLMSK